ncbi:MAG TPA: thiamine phosphate synthase [Terriglobales bacterium]|nr:thiamine phosphate synthase [Terriglobales bacterium]
MADGCLLYYITDRIQFLGDEHSRRRALLAKVGEAATAGVDYIQLREKDIRARELEVLARDALAAVRNSFPLRPESRGLRTRLLINSRTDIALAVGADGVHLRADDVAPPEVRQMLGLAGHQPLTTDHFLVAASCHTAADVLRAESEKADFAVFAPVFGKRGAAGTSPAGLAALREACRVKIPVFALGGITIENAASCLEAGAVGVAGIRLFQENKIEDVVRTLRAR